MKSIKRRRVLVGMVALLLFSMLGGAHPSARQSNDHLNRLREAAKALKEKLGPRAKFLSSGGQQFLALGPQVRQ
jgi:ABC-type branched-subunit amino acid transport system ATPase component